MQPKDTIDAVAKGALSEFSDAGDFAWKVPSFIALQRRIEGKTLREEMTAEVRQLRFRLEGRKLFEVFPYLLTNGTRFTIISLFEAYLFRLVLLLERQTGRSRTEARGQGAEQAFAFFRLCGIVPHRISLWPQIGAMLKIRNCMMHASGVLAHSRDRQEIHRLIRSEAFLDEKHRGKDPDEPLLEIRDSSMGPRLHVSYQYPWLVTAYCRDFIIEACELAKELPTKSRKSTGG